MGHVIGLASSDLADEVAAFAIQVSSLSEALPALTARVAALEAGSATLAALASTNAAVVALTQRVATIEGKPDPCVALTGSLPVGPLQIGTTTLSVQVPGLLATDRVAVEPTTDLPAGLVLAWAHPSAAGVLSVAIDALAVVAIKAAIPLAVTALR